MITFTINTPFVTLPLSQAIMDDDDSLRQRCEALALEEDEALDVNLPANPPSEEFHYVGKLMTDKPFNETTFKRTISKLWLPKCGVNIRKIAADNRFLIRFFHVNDYEKVWKGSPWSFNMKLLVLTPRKINEDP